MESAPLEAMGRMFSRSPLIVSTDAFPVGVTYLPCTQAVNPEATWTLWKGLVPGLVSITLSNTPASNSAATEAARSGKERPLTLAWVSTHWISVPAWAFFGVEVPDGSDSSWEKAGETRSKALPINRLSADWLKTFIKFVIPLKVIEVAEPRLCPTA